jgi:hypothetical protein
MEVYLHTFFTFVPDDQLHVRLVYYRKEPSGSVGQGAGWAPKLVWTMLCNVKENN